MNNKIQEIKKAVQLLEANYPIEIWDWEEKQMAYLLSEYERLTIKLESVNQALRDGVPAGMRTAEEYQDWLYSVLPFLDEDGDKE